MSNPAIDISQLSLDQRIALLDELLVSMPDDALSPTEAQQQELARRVERFHHTGPLGADLDEVLDQIRGQPR